MNPIDSCLSELSPENQVALSELRAVILGVIPDAVECISYGMPAFKVRGEAVAGFAVFKKHLSFFPFSGYIVGEFAQELEGYVYTKSGVHFTPEKPLPKDLVERMIRRRLEMLG